MNTRTLLPMGLFAVPLWGCASLHARAAAPDEAGVREAPIVVDRDPPAAGATVVVHLESTVDASLVRLDADDAVVERCRAPCDRALPLRATYRVDGPEIRSSWPFSLIGAPGDRVVVQVTPDLRSTYEVGKTMGNVGGVAAALGFGAALIGGIVATTDADADNGAPARCPACTASFVGGAILMLAGIGVATAGIVVVISNMSSGASQRVDAPTQAPPPSTRSSEVVWPREVEAPVVRFHF